MKKKRVFIAINLPEDIKKELAAYQNKFEWENATGWARWTKIDNLHITLEFLGDVWEKDMEEVFKKAEEMASKTSSFGVKLDKIDYFPNSDNPKFIFATGGEYHITLARIREWQWRKINPDERPEVREGINLEFEVSSINVMESQLSRKGLIYTILKSFKL